MITLDIILVTYNQEQYVQQALNGILIQRVNQDVQVRIIVADDCSKDNTLSLITKTLGQKTKIASGNSVEVVYLPVGQNLGIAKNYQRAIAATTGDYVAILEGDDYWIDAYRLQNHVDYLSIHADCVMTVNDYMEYSQERGEWMWKPISRKYLLLREMIANYCLANLSARVYKGEVLRNVEDKIFKYGEKQRGEATDYYMTMDVLRHGYGYVLDEVMSVYRVDTHANISKRKMTYEEDIERGRICYVQMSEMLNGEYVAECKQIHTNAVKMVAQDKQNRHLQAWSDYASPIVAKLIWIWIPACWHVIKYTIRQCVPNKLYRIFKTQ